MIRKINTPGSYSWGIARTYSSKYRAFVYTTGGVASIMAKYSRSRIGGQDSHFFTAFRSLSWSIHR